MVKIILLWFCIANEYCLITIAPQLMTDMSFVAKRSRDIRDIDCVDRKSTQFTLFRLPATISNIIEVPTNLT